MREKSGIGRFGRLWVFLLKNKGLFGKSVYLFLAVSVVTSIVQLIYHSVMSGACGCREDADKLAELLSKSRKPKEIIIVNHEPATGSHLGPKALALYFLGDERVRFA